MRLAAATWVAIAALAPALAAASQPDAVAMVAAGFDVGDGRFCTGTALNARSVLTAAHCLDVVPVGGAFAVVAADGQRIEVEDATVHPAWDPDRLDSVDLAVLHLAAPGLGAVTAAMVGDPVVGTTTAVTRIHASGTWHFVALVTAGDSATCVAGQPFVHTDDSCWSSMAAPLCKGESGSPLWDHSGVVGVVSWSGAACQPGPWAAQRVAPHADWVAEAATLPVESHVTMALLAPSVEPASAPASTVTRMSAFNAEGDLVPHRLVALLLSVGALAAAVVAAAVVAARPMVTRMPAVVATGRRNRSGPR
ncbi:MAG: S1 family peptidase [Actinomycetia bacterium]|nr:S1 family peptidase [Actinomycetes bacterium]